MLFKSLSIASIVFILVTGISSSYAGKDGEPVCESSMTSTLVDFITDKNVILSHHELSELVRTIRSGSDNLKAHEYLKRLADAYQERIDTFQAGLEFLNFELSNLNVAVSNEDLDSNDSRDTFEGFFDIKFLETEDAHEKIKEFLYKLCGFDHKKLDTFVCNLLNNVSKKHDALLKFYAFIFLDENNYSSRNYGHAARVHLKRAALGIKGAKADFYKILENFSSLYSNYSAHEAQNLYPICLEEIQKGDQTTKELLEQNYIHYGFLEGIFQYYVKKGDEDSIETAWNLYQQHKKITRNQKIYIINYWAAKPFIDFYKTKADGGDLEACRRITEMALPVETYMVSFSVATEYYAKAMDLGDLSARSGLLNALNPLRTSDYEGIGLNKTYLKWVEGKNDVEILKATADALVKTDKNDDSSKDLETAQKIYDRIHELESTPH